MDLCTNGRQVSSSLLGKGQTPRAENPKGRSEDDKQARQRDEGREEEKRNSRFRLPQGHADLPAAGVAPTSSPEHHEHQTRANRGGKIWCGRAPNTRAGARLRWEGWEGA